ncbi:ATP-binding protein, partial [Shigella sonnei]|uniref:ATP-binding protein n=1 Tax=Shigella sonnei TaxID=624 RepID=UPI003EBA8C6B
MRKPIRTEQGANGAIRELEKFRQQGFTPENRQLRVEKILNRSGIQPLHRKCSFANYQVQNDGQRYALSQAKSIADELMTGCTNFAFSGKPGTGKNHLAAAIGNRLLKDGQTVIVVTVADVM